MDDDSKTWTIGGKVYNRVTLRRECERRRNAGLILAGRTYPDRQELRDAGGIFDDELRVWLMPDLATINYWCSRRKRMYRVVPGIDPSIPIGTAPRPEPGDAAHEAGLRMLDQVQGGTGRLGREFAQERRERIKKVADQVHTGQLTVEQGAAIINGDDLVFSD